MNFFTYLKSNIFRDTNDYQKDKIKRNLQQLNKKKKGKKMCLRKARPENTRIIFNKEI